MRMARDRGRVGAWMQVLWLIETDAECIRTASEPGISFRNRIPD